MDMSSNELQSFLGLVSTVLTIAFSLFSLFKIISSLKKDSFFSASYKKASADLATAHEFYEENCNALGDGMGKQAIRTAARTLARKETGIFFGPVMFDLMMMGIAFIATIAMLVAPKVFIGNADNWYSCIFICFCLVGYVFFMLLMMLAAVLAGNDVSSIFDLWDKYKARKARKESAKKGYGLNRRKVSSYPHQPNSCILIDARPSDERKRTPIKYSISKPYDFSKFVEKIPEGSVVFTCSNFGQESYEVVDELKKAKFENAFDLGMMKGRAVSIDRSMRELFYRGLLVDPQITIKL